MKYSFAKVLLVIGKILLVISLIFILFASQPCSGDGCICRVFYLIGVPLLLISILMIFVAKRIIKKNTTYDYSKLK